MPRLCHFIIIHPCICKVSECCRVVITLKKWWVPGLAYFITKFCIVSLWIRINSRLVDYYSTGLPDCPILIIFTPVLALFMTVVALLYHSKTWWVPGSAYFTNTFSIVCLRISIISTYVEFYSTGLPRLCHFINIHPCICIVYECCRIVITFKNMVSTWFYLTLSTSFALFA